MKKTKLIRITTIPGSFMLLKGQMKHMSENGFEVIMVSSPGERLDQAINEEGVRGIPIPMSRRISLFQDLKALSKLCLFLREEKPTIVHTHTPKAGFLGMIASWIVGVPIRLHTVAGLPLMEARGIKRVVLNLAEILTYRCATKVYSNSAGLYNFILDRKFINSAKLNVIGKGSSNGIDVKRFAPDLVEESRKTEIRKDLGISEGDFVFIFVGRMVGDKGVNELVKAFSTLIKRERSKTIKLLMLGHFEPELDPLKAETVRLLESQSSIIYVGFKQDVTLYFSVADALVFPSYREGFPNVVLQAGAMGLPSIVTDINGCNEIVMEGVNGSIVPPKDHNKLLTAMSKMMCDEEYYERLQSNARRSIISRYDQKDIWRALLEEYADLLVRESR